MMKPHKLAIPYRLNTPEDISEAMRLKLVPEGEDYEDVLELAQKIILRHPPAFRKAKEKISKQFIRIRDEKIIDIERLINTPTHLCRLRHFDLNRWSVAFYTYSDEKYSPCIFSNGDWFGTPEEAFDIGAVYLM